MDRSHSRLVPVIETIPADLHTPLSVYLKLAAGSDNSFLLESVEGGESLGRYSFIGADPEMSVRGNASCVTITNARGEQVLDVPMFDFLRDHFSRVEVDRSEDLPPLIGGAIGCLGFNTAGWFEPSLENHETGNDADFMFFRSIVAFDHARQLIRIISLALMSNDVDGEGSTNAAQDRIASIIRVIETGTLQLPVTASAEPGGSIESNWSRNEFENAVAEIKELIAAGECYQVVISQCFSRPTKAHPVSIYRAMRSLNPSPYMFLIKTDQRAVIGASPEMLVKCSGSTLEYRPIAGTRPRGKDPGEDSILAEEMRADVKEVAEHLMLVDLGRNDLGRVAEYGSVVVEGLMSVEKYSHVQHLVSYLSAKLRTGLDRFDALAACFPAGTVSGAPKVRAIQIINSMEPTPRGLYAGAVGYFDYAGNMDMCIAIRTMVLEGGVAKVQAGAGIVADSIPAMEYQETVDKARALLKAIELAEAKGA